MPKKMAIKVARTLLAGLVILCLSSGAQGAEFFCEVMTLQGQAYVTNADASRRALKEGDLIKAEDEIEVDAEALLDLAFDKEWKNVTRLGAGSKIKIQSVHPSAMALKRGSILAQLKDLPAGSTFEIQTPVAIAAVRGSIYSTKHSDAGTEIFNLSNSPVSVFGLDGDGNLIPDPVDLRNGEKSFVDKPNTKPNAPRKMDSEEHSREIRSLDGLKDRVDILGKDRKFGRIQSTKETKALFRDKIKTPEKREKLVKIREIKKTINMEKRDQKRNEKNLKRRRPIASIENIIKRS